MITAPQLRAARSLLGIDQRRLAELSGLSVPTIQRMEASGSIIRGNVDSLMKLIAALEISGIELIGEGAPSPGGGRGVRLKSGFDPAKAPEPDGGQVESGGSQP
ncbi:MAG: XRE family transcriptional regulator [Mesorhizobium sp.]|uniref:helix-turn-helix domain-containing protein n=1 Tax=Mesorhizobium sp. TaxID=1871066 RepID=UPI000FE49271|nr:helix-turn-helix transcriptional regulator [Mesorhizobium sp.]RWB78346.1 MAG: XRE family transcriptional regulator [Mesorhizobium sp.]RWL82123.1 MAG: XRE family transcriptional regulator [Mesorhizobium sp.]RWL87472.1 MAG: XRE family transcriptional regulator [Mesorhizobium sp.]RWL98812.1 MAG: XRE family transcriptional regulator [Mesorhizobium sp.]RWM03946.1 MAG: XRE family transcriptional regulator [Mesorhizobium sp.]